MIDIKNNIVSQYIPQEELHQLVPHRGKMLLLSRVTAHNVTERSICAEYDITDSCLFYDRTAGGIPSWTAFEIMAQSVSALASLLHIANRDYTEARMGFILSISEYKAKENMLKGGTSVRVEAKEDFHTGSLFRYVCSLYKDKDAEEASVTANLTAMEVDSLQEFLQMTGNHI